jgi:putative aldouronate transport system substrate-binding protein
MRVSRKALMLCLIAVLTVSLFAGCSSNNGGAAENPNANEALTTGESAEGSSDDGISEGFKNGKFDPPVTISIVAGTDSTIETKPGETIEDNFVTQWARDSLGINFDFLWVVPKDQTETKTRLMLTSGEKLPDVVWTSGTLLSDLLESGQYKEVGADFDKYASDAMKEAYSDPSLWDMVTRDGKRMGIPVFERAGQNNGLMWIRQDWLDKLSLQAPTTFEELEAVLTSFKDNADQLGAPDLTPLGLSLKSGTRGWFGESTWVFGPYGTIPGQWVKGEDGKLVSGSVHPGMKQGLTHLSKWYQSGLISKEVGLHDENKVAELAMQGKVGIVVSPPWSAGWPYTDMEKNVPGALMKAYPLPSDNGKAGSMDTNFKSSGLLVHKDFKDTDALFLYLNKIFEYKNPAVGSEFEKGFKEGYDYVTLPDGTVSVNEDDFPDKLQIFPDKFFIAPMQDPYMEMKIASKIVKGEEPESPAEQKAAISYKENPDQMEAIATVYDTIDQYIANEFNGPPSRTQVDKGALLDKMEFEELLKFVYGKAPIEDFDKFVSAYSSAGGEQVAKEVNEAYSKIQGN